MSNIAALCLGVSTPYLHLVTPWTLFSTLLFWRIVSLILSIISSSMERSMLAGPPSGWLTQADTSGNSSSTTPSRASPPTSSTVNCSSTITSKRSLSCLLSSQVSAWRKWVLKAPFLLESASSCDYETIFTNNSTSSSEKSCYLN